MFQTEIN